MKARRYGRLTIGILCSLLIFGTSVAHAWLGSKARAALEEKAIEKGYDPNVPQEKVTSGYDEETGTSWYGNFRNKTATYTLRVEKVNKMFEDYAQQVFGTPIDAKNGRKGMVCVYGAVSSVYSAWVSQGAAAYLADVTGTDGSPGIANMAWGYASAGNAANGIGANGVMAVYQFSTSSAMPSSAEEANALFDKVIGPSARYGSSFTAFREGWYIKARYKEEVDFEDPMMRGATGCTIKILVVPDPVDPSKTLIVHLTGLGTAATQVY